MIFDFQSMSQGGIFDFGEVLVASDIQPLSVIRESASLGGFVQANTGGIGASVNPPPVLTEAIYGPPLGPPPSDSPQQPNPNQP